MIDTSMFRNVYLFSQLSDATLAGIAAVLETRRYDPGQVLFHQGDPGDDLFIVREGSVGIFEPSPDKPGEETPIRIFQAGEVFGEMALIDRQPRTLSARALAPTETWLLHREAFQALLRDHDMALAVMASLNDRIRYTTEFLSEVQGWVGRVAKGEYEFVDDVRGWVRQVAEGAYDEPFQARTPGRDPTIAALAADFARMAARVKQREDALRQEIAQLRIEIDETKRERQVAEITESDYFKDIQAQARRLRQKRG